MLPVAAWAARAALRVALVAGGSAAVLAVALLRDGWSGWRLALAALLFAPAAVLLAFRLACREALELPDRLRALPGAAAQNAGELARLLRARGRGRTRRGWRLLLLSRSTRELLTPYAPLVALLSPPFLLATAAAAAAAAIEAAAAVVVLVALVA